MSSAPESKEPPKGNEKSGDQQSSKKQERIDYTSGKIVNIGNIVEDFKKTLAAIGATPDVNEEVHTYLKLVETQSLKEKPSAKLIRSNLKNAAGILDEYITQTLNKPSKVVNDWIDALLLQNVNFKTDKVPEIPKAEPPEVIQPEPAEPQNPELISLYREAENFINSGKFRKALTTYDGLLPEVKAAGDKSIETKIYLDKAYIHDVNKNYPSALENYNKASILAQETGNHTVRAFAHYNMASIYDEFGKTDLALEHYYEAIVWDGQEENIKEQTLTLNDVGNLFSSMRDYRQAIDHYQVGLSLAKDTDDIKGQAFLLSNTGTVFKDIGKDSKALKFYKKSIECDMKIGNFEGCSINFANSADIMLRNNHSEKAEKLYKKSLSAAQKLGDRELANRILEKLQRNNLSY